MRDRRGWSCKHSWARTKPHQSGCHRGERDQLKFECVCFRKSTFQKGSNKNSKFSKLNTYKRSIQKKKRLTNNGLCPVVHDFVEGIRIADSLELSRVSAVDQSPHIVGLVRLDGESHRSRGRVQTEVFAIREGGSLEKMNGWNIRVLLFVEIWLRIRWI